MTATHSIASTVLVAIDISKHRHEVLIGVPGKKRRRRSRGDKSGNDEIALGHGFFDHAALHEQVDARSSLCTVVVR